MREEEGWLRFVLPFAKLVRHGRMIALRLVRVTQNGRMSEKAEDGFDGDPCTTTGVQKDQLAVSKHVYG
jgi:hypothetical protein